MVTTTSFRQWAAASGQSQEQIARRLGCSRSYISQLVSGGKTPSLEMVRRMLLIGNGHLRAEDLIVEFTIGI